MKRKLTDMRVKETIRGTEMKMRHRLLAIFCIVLSILTFWLAGWKVFLAFFLFAWADKVATSMWVERRSEMVRDALIKDLEMGLHKQQE